MLDSACREAKRRAVTLRCVVEENVDKLSASQKLGRPIASTSGAGYSVANQPRPGGSSFPLSTLESEALSFWGRVLSVIKLLEPSYPDNNDGLLAALLQSDPITNEVTEYRTDFSTYRILPTYASP